MKNIRLFRVLAVFAVLLLSVSVTVACGESEFDVDGDVVKVAAVKIDSFMQNEEDSWDFEVWENPLLREPRIYLGIYGETIYDFAFLENHPDLTHLSIKNSTIKSFDYFAENLRSLQELSIDDTTIDSSLGAIPHISSLLVLHTSPLEDAFRLAELNTHVDTFTVLSGYTSARMDDDYGKVAHVSQLEGIILGDPVPGAFELHVTLEPIKYFTNMTFFAFYGAATTVDLSYLRYATELVTIDISRSVYGLRGVEYLAELPNLQRFNVPIQGGILNALSDNGSFIYNKNVSMGQGS